MIQASKMADFNRKRNILTTTLSYGLPTTLLTYLSSNPPNPTANSASTSNGLSSGFHPTHSLVDEKPGEDGARTVEDLQKGIKDA